MTSPDMKTVKRLCMLSGNKCAFPKCTHTLVDEVSGKVTGRISHIKASSKGGERYDPVQSDEERHGFDNLILLCSAHHDVVDADPEAYTVARLLKMKQEHEAQQQLGEEPSDLVALQFIVNNINVAGGAIAYGPIVGQNSGVINYTLNEQSYSGSRPVFTATVVGSERREEDFTPLIRLRHEGGDSVPAVRIRFRTPRILDQPWRSLTLNQLQSTMTNNRMDMRVIHRDDPVVAPDQLGLEIEYQWRGIVCRELHRWPLTRQVVPRKVLLDIGDELEMILIDPPKLALEFEPHHPFIEVLQEGPAGQSREVGRLIRIGVRNLTDTTIRRVSAVIERFERLDPYDGHAVQDLVEGTLQIEGRDPQLLVFDLPPQGRQLVRVVLRPTTVDSAVEMAICYASFKSPYVPALRHVFHISVHADEIRLDTEAFIVDVLPDGNLAFRRDDESVAVPGICN